MVASALSSSSVFDDRRAVVAREPDLVHAVVERDDPVVGHHRAHVGDDALRGDREAVVVAAGEVRAGCRRAAAASAEAFGRPALEPVGEQGQAAADVADDLGVREVHLLDLGRRVADVDDRRTARAHQERRLLDRVVPDREDQVGPVDRLVDVVALGQRGGAQSQARRSPATTPLPICVLKKGIRGTAQELAQIRGQARPAGRGAEHDQRALRAAQDRPAARSSAAAAATGSSTCAAAPAARRRRAHPRRPRAARGARGRAVPRSRPGTRRGRRSGCSRC